MKRTIWIAAGAGLVVSALVAAGAVRARVPEYLISGVRCSDAEARMAASLGHDPMLTSRPPGITPIAVQPLDHPYQPCEGNGDDRYYGGATRGYDLPPADRPLAEIADYYRDLGAANGWTMSAPAAGELVGRKTIDGTAVVFDLSGLERGEHDTAYWVELRYAARGSTHYLVTIEDTVHPRR